MRAKTFSFSPRAPERARRRSIAQSAEVFLDSAEQLGWFGWREVLLLTRRANALVVTVHRPGRLRTVMDCSSSPQLLAELVGELTGRDGKMDDLWRRHGGNIRLALRELYDTCADTESPV